MKIKNEEKEKMKIGDRVKYKEIIDKGDEITEFVILEIDEIKALIQFTGFTGKIPCNLFLKPTNKVYIADLKKI